MSVRDLPGGRPPRRRRPPRRLRRPYRATRRRHSQTAGLAVWLLLIAGIALVAWWVDRAPTQVGASSWQGAEPGTGTAVLDGRPQVTDGDTLRIKGVRIRVQGIDAPEMATSEGRRAKAHLKALVGSGSVECRDTGERSYDRIVGVCTLASGEDLASRMVEDGWAVDLPRFSGGRYADLERQAAEQRIGMHAPY